MIQMQCPLHRSWWRAVLVSFTFVVGILALPNSAHAVNCPPPNPDFDTDKDGFTDGQECSGFTTLGTAGKRFEPCVPGADGFIANRRDCLDPNSKDVFIIYRPMASGSLLTNVPPGFPFGQLQYTCKRSDNSSWCGSAGVLRYDGFVALGLTAHQLTPNQAASDRTVTQGSTQKAVRVTESLDTSNPAELGYCSYGTPLGLDGCTIFTQRTLNFINEKCTTAKDTVTDRRQVLIAYSTFLAIHEAGHALGGLTAVSDPSVGGYHYASSSNVMMSQAAEYSTQSKRCTWYIPSLWNLTLDAPAVQLIIE